MRTPLSVLAMVSMVSFASAFAIGCSAETSEGEDVEISADELTVANLRARTKPANVVASLPDGTQQVEYLPDAAHGYVEGAPVAFEAVPFTATTSGEAVQVTVEGDFPSSATVVVTDSQMRVAGFSSTRGLDRTALTVTAPADGFVLVRDLRWVKPMRFDVRVAPAIANR